MRILLTLRELRGGSVNTEKVLYCFHKIFLKNTRKSETSQPCFILSSKHTYRPMRARAVAQLFHKVQYSIVQYSFVESLQLKRVLEVAIIVVLWTKLKLKVYFLYHFDTVFELVL